MNMSKEYDMDDMDKLLKELDKKGVDIKKAIKKGVIKTTFDCTKKAKKRAPVAKVNGGQLRASIHSNVKIKNDSVIGESAPNTEYEVYPEFGTGQRGMASKIEKPESISYSADWKGQEAQPYMYPAFLETRDELLPNIKKELEKILNK